MKYTIYLLLPLSIRTAKSLYIEVQLFILSIYTLYDEACHLVVPLPIHIAKNLHIEAPQFILPTYTSYNKSYHYSSSHSHSQEISRPRHFTSSKPLPVPTDHLSYTHLS